MTLTINRSGICGKEFEKAFVDHDGYYYAQALKLFQPAIAIDPGDVNAYYNDGDVHVNQIYTLYAKLFTTRLLLSPILEKVNTLIIWSTAAATLSVLVFGTAGLATIFAQPAFTSKLSGSNEVPPVTTAASGIATFQLLPLGHQLVMNYQLSLKNITGVTAANIHSGNQGENGPTVAVLFNSSNPTGAINGRLATGTLTSSKLAGPLHDKLSLSSLVNMIRSGEAYVNVHTTLKQHGEVRGQIS